MKKCIIISDSFKGTLSSREICDIAEAGVEKIFPGCQVVRVPVADGGEGTVECFHEACGGELVSCSVQGPYGEPIEAVYLQLSGGRAVVEMASAAGLPQVGDRKDPCRTSTYGVGQIIRHAVERGNREILLGLGGSCTNDGGCGCAAALGVRFLDGEGTPFIPTGDTLDRIASIDVSGAEALLAGVQLAAMCDIDNPMHGPRGAAHIFGPQKGADAATVELLDRQLRALDGAMRRCLGREVADIPGAGAAGGFGAGVLALLDGQLRPGIEVVLDLVGFEALLEGCDVVFTGEGRLDSQSIGGKAISGIGKRARRRGVPVVILAGGVLPEAEGICNDPESGISAVFSINRQAMAFEESRWNSRDNYAYTIDNILRLMALAEGI